MSDGSVSITIPDLAKIRKKLGGRPSLVSQSTRKAMATAAKSATSIFKQGAPKRTGKLSGSAKPQSTAYTAKVLFDPIASQGRGKGATFRSGYALSASRRFPSTFGYREKIKAQVTAGPAKQAIAEISKTIEQLWRA